jgi:2-methylcitrate dehydratase PrpD
MKEPLRSRLADFIVRTRIERLPEDVIHQSERCLLDLLGVALAGSRTGCIPAISKVHYGLGGKEEATVLGDGRKVPAPHAALLNGAKGHALDMDDGHRFANAHPSVVVIPAALALAERDDVSGVALIEAIVVGYETLVRIAKSINPSHLRRGFHTTATVGSFGAAAACCKILNLSQREVGNALSIAGLTGSGLLEVMASGQGTKPFQTGRASQAGLLASLLAKAGAEGPDLIFEGQKGFLGAYSDHHDLEQGIADLGDNNNYEILNVYFKMHAACRHIHPALDAMSEIMSKAQIDLGKIKRIEVKTYSVAFELTGQNRTADTELAAKFSLPVSLALLLIYGRAGADEYAMECICDPRVRTLAEKVEVAVDLDRDKVYPKHRGSRVRLVTPDEAHAAEVELPKGEPENPFSEDELVEKFRMNASKALSPSEVRNIQECVLDLEHSSVRELMNWIHTCSGTFTV